MENLVEFTDNRIRRMKAELGIGNVKRWATAIVPATNGRFKVTLACPKGKRQRHVLVEAKELNKFRVV